MRLAKGTLIMSSVKNGIIKIEREIDGNGQQIVSNLVIKTTDGMQVTIKLPYYIKVYFSQLPPIPNEPYTFLNETNVAACQFVVESEEKEADE
jgi:hypothetical protein